MHTLILGGTTEANQLAGLLENRPDIRATLSLAGRTQNPVLPPISYRIGGFGGVDGLVAWIRANKVTALIDATHPFARRMPFNAAQAAHETGVKFLALTRPAWQAQASDNWTEVADHAQAIALLGYSRRRIFLTVGRLEINAYAAAPQHFYVVRSIDPVEAKTLPNAVWITARPPFTVESESALIGEHAIDTVITKNSGGDATKAKLTAARELGLPVILIARPKRPDAEMVTTAKVAFDWITRTHALSCSLFPPP